MTVDNGTSRLDEEVGQWLLATIRDGTSLDRIVCLQDNTVPHADDTIESLEDCPTARIEFLRADEGMYGCDSGCAYLRLMANLTCDCAVGFEMLEYGTFGDLDSLLYAFTEWKASLRESQGAKR